MRTTAGLFVACALLAETATATLFGGFFPPLQWVYKWEGGNGYACKCYPGDWCWPGQLQWKLLNLTVAGNLDVVLPPAASCYNKFKGPLGTVNSYNAAKCATATEQWASEQWHIEQPAAGLWTYFTNDTCRPTSNPSDTCTLGYYPVLVIKAKTISHIQAGINFARNNNLRLVIRNTGHDFLGRSVGWGSLVINTHSFKNIQFTNKWTGAGAYRGPAVTVGAGVQAFEVLAKANALKPPRVMVTGECGTVGVAGGLVQGGGHGPLTNQYGFLADTALEFKVITADGQQRTANAKTNSDLFWALKGGGPSAFAVITSATYKTFEDLPSSGITLDIFLTNTTLFWEAFSKFHSYSTHFVDNGIYVYYEVGFAPGLLHVQPIVGYGKTPAQLQAIVQPLFDDLDAMGVEYTTTSATFPTFYELYKAMFEIEAAGNSALTGGWTFGRQDVVNNHTAIIEAMKDAIAAGSPLIGHMWSAGHGLPQSEWANSAVHPNFRNVVDKLITLVFVNGNAPLSEKAASQQTLTYAVDGVLKAASPNGAAYINEADPYRPDWQQAFWGPNYARLLQLKSKFDPHGVFYSIATPGTEKWTQIETGTRLCKRI